MNSKKLLMAGCLLLLLFKQSPAQSDTPRIELGAQFALIGLDSVRPALSDVTAAGFGGRVTWNLNHRYSLEGEANYFPRDQRERRQQTQALFGLKTTWRIENAGAFLKIRPGLLRSSIEQTVVCVTAPCLPLVKTRNDFTLDVGGGLEFYTSPHTMVRFDFGDTIIRYNNVPCLGAGCPRRATTHNFQFNAGVGWRF